MRRRGLALAGLVIAAVACDAADPPVVCEDVGVARAAMTAADRKLIGASAPYVADGALRGRDLDLARSKKLRREVAWRTVEKVLAQVPVAEEAVPVAGASVPTWQTWYGRDDVQRLFHRLYEGLGTQGRAARAAFTEEALDEAFAWNPRAVEELENWPLDRWQEYVASIDTAAEVNGVSGIGRVAYSPSAARHALASYREALDCLESGAPAAFADGPPEESRRLSRETVRLGACESHAAGPFFVAGGETLRAVTSRGDDAAITVLEGDALVDASVRCTASATDGCSISGPGVFFVTVSANGRPIDTMLSVDYTAPVPEWSACLATAFPNDAAVIKADWRRAGVGWDLPTYDTSAAGLAWHMAIDGGPFWGDGDSSADPGPDRIYTVTLPANGNVFRLAALHIMTKELDHWLWITLWWSSSPDEDFGADRPASLGGVWSSYKMCVATSFDELDPDPEGGFGATHPSLARALAAVHADSSWCSNPYLEAGHGNAATNCIGCHQHATSGVLPEVLLSDDEHFPDFTRPQLRNNFPSDYSWALSAGDHLTSLFSDEVTWWSSETP
jgi:hypothetical protein